QKGSVDPKLGRAELECEEAIMMDKQRFGRVRTTLMRHLRSQYGIGTANRALARINKRASNGSLRMKKHLEEFSID
ncbi:MAG TPA: hypothetical protein VFM64_03030, partial [Candidatus Nitrosotenuis sp.]|nr:hypothetical protein [Candidatus Nitrosotenuis sp.]